MVYRIFGAITFVLISLTAFGLAIPALVTGIFALVAGIALGIGY
jgi:hypothetical protein